MRMIERRLSGIVAKMVSLGRRSAMNRSDDHGTQRLIASISQEQSLNLKLLIPAGYGRNRP